jgi:hypothetical protein
VVSQFNKLSSCQTVVLSSNMDNIIFKKYTRYFDGGYKLNFYNALSGVSDYKHKNHTNFFLTRNTQISNILESNDDPLKSDSFLTTMNFGGNYLSFKPANLKQLGTLGIYNQYNNYGDYSFLNSGDSPSSNFIISLKDDNVCDIHYFYNYKKYYLRINPGNQLVFTTDKVGSPTKDFHYIYSRPNKAIFLFQTVDNTPYFVKKTGSLLSLVEMTSANKLVVYNNPIYLNKDIYTDFTVNNNTTYVEYDTDNTINKDGVLKNLPNNYLLHREQDSTDIIVLKNQLTPDEIFTSGNSLLSSNSLKFFVDGMRNYTSIFNDINSENDESLLLNYIIYNKSYKITPGKNIIVAPDDMNPFSKLNINDTKFINCGSFAFPTPQYADKVYRVDTSVAYTDDQTYLCTWLSGSPISNNKVWVDRYYYPDRISKEDALRDNNSFNVTYEDTIEQLILNNTSIQNSISSFYVFDKKSDMVFIPNGKYVYERISYIDSVDTTEVTPCQNIASSNSNINYFKQLNEVGKFTIQFYFSGSSDNWVMKSKRNNIDGGLSVVKSGDSVEISLKLYDPATLNITTFSTKENFKPLQDNFISISVDVVNGSAYFFLNNQVIDTFRFLKTKFYGKNILFGDFVLDNVDVFSQDRTKIQNFKILNNYISPELSFTTPILDGRLKIDDIYLTLPCGMRNVTDVIEYIQSVCNNQSFKSNNINIYIKNIGVEPDVQTELSDKITNTINKFTPITTELNGVVFTDFKQ